MAGRVCLKRRVTGRYSSFIMVFRLAHSKPLDARFGATRQRLVSLVKRARRRHNRMVLAILACGVIAIGAGGPHVSPVWFPPAALVLPVFAGGLLLRVRSLAALLAVVCLALSYDAFRLGPVSVGPGILATVAVTALIALLMSRMRQRIGVRGMRGEQMLLELRDRLRAQGELPHLPDGWQAQTELGHAGGSSFGGDFVVATLSPDGKTLEVALVDVSGKGVDAATRALLLSGAVGGLLGSVASDRFLPAVNDYLLRQKWGEGFATALHLNLDLRTGAYVVASAGHPPAAQYEAGSGTWRITSAEGSVLGVLPEVSSVPERGLLRQGDALLLYTDGLIENRGRDLDVGIDRLLGRAERLVTRGFRDGAAELLTVLPSPPADDCALVVIWRG